MEKKYFRLKSRYFFLIINDRLKTIDFVEKRKLN